MWSQLHTPKYKMEFPHLGFLLAFLCLVHVGNHVEASLPAEEYWQSLWPNTPMPKALKDLTQSDSEWRNLRASGRANHSKVGNEKIELSVYDKAANKDNDPSKLQFHELNVTFFLEHDLHPGKKLNLELTKHSDQEFTFLPDKVAKSTPFSSTRFSEILNHFNIEAKSSDAETLKYTLDTCEIPAINGEDKYCATSLESLVDFSVSKLGKNIKVVSTVLELAKETQKQKQKQQYTIMEGVKKIGNSAVACHKMNYLYAVFYCHKVSATRAYTVPLVAADGVKAKALAICHSVTRNWSKQNVALQQLKIKPGTVPVCHFLAADTLLWVPN